MNDKIGEFTIDRNHGFQAFDKDGNTFTRPSVYRVCPGCGYHGSRGKDIDDAHTKDMNAGWVIIRASKAAIPSVVVCPSCKPSETIAMVN